MFLHQKKIIKRYYSLDNHLPLRFESLVRLVDRLLDLRNFLPLERLRRRSRLGDLEPELDREECDDLRRLRVRIGDRVRDRARPGLDLLRFEPGLEALPPVWLYFIAIVSGNAGFFFAESVFRRSVSGFGASIAFPPSRWKIDDFEGVEASTTSASSISSSVWSRIIRSSSSGMDSWGPSTTFFWTTAGLLTFFRSTCLLTPISKSIGLTSACGSTTRSKTIGLRFGAFSTLSSILLSSNSLFSVTSISFWTIGSDFSTAFCAMISSQSGSYLANDSLQILILFNQSCWELKNIFDKIWAS